MPSIRLGCRSPRPRRSGRSGTSPASRSRCCAASERHRDRAMAGWQGVKALEELFGYEPGGSDSAVPARRDGGRRRRGCPPRRYRHRGHTARSGRRLQTSRATSCATRSCTTSTGGRLRTPAARDLPRRSPREPDVHGALGGGDPDGRSSTPSEWSNPSRRGSGLPSTTNQFAIVRDSDVLVGLAGEYPRSWRSSRASSRPMAPTRSPPCAGETSTVRFRWAAACRTRSTVTRCWSPGTSSAASSRVNGPSGSGALC